MSGTVNTGFVLDMQSKLYRWSTADPDKRYADLFNLVCDRRTIAAAWQKLSQNQGSQTPGTDGVTRRKVEERPDGVAAFLEEIQRELRNGTYKPQPVRQRLIPKPGKPGKFRPLGIPTLRDRLVQMTLKLVLEPIFEADFYPTSYGFRRGRSTHDALARIQRRLHPGNGSGPSQTRFVIEGDIKGCFDAIDHHVLMERVRRRIMDAKVLRLILAFLKADIMVEGTLRHPVTGTPQGGIVSPLLSNIYLTAIDERYGRWSPRPREGFEKATARRKVDRRAGRPTFSVVRYADDFVVLVEGTLEQAEAERQALAAFLKQELRMELSMEKTKITDVREGFDFLGYRVAQKPARHDGNRVGKLFIPKSKLGGLRHKIKVKVRATPTGDSLAELIESLNPIITGWRNYYRYAARAWREFAKLDWWMEQRMARWVRKKHRGVTWQTLRRKYNGPRPGKRRRWSEGTKQLRFFSDGGTCRFADRGNRIPNGWNAEPEQRFLPGATDFWEATNTLAKLM
ncbi:group II intron reverse transcriptase/maturase [Rhizobiales bacterium GAS113]|nr:group II intron reverse transcriptase/maturase [Rhizobiales bacterium GAS113]